MKYTVAGPLETEVVQPPVASLPDANRVGVTQPSLGQAFFGESGNMLIPPSSQRPPG